MTIKEMSIREYISHIDFKRDDWKVSKMLEDMKKFLGEQPSIDIVYKKDLLINETTQEAKEIVDIDKVQIVFFDTDNHFKKLEFIIGSNI